MERPSDREPLRPLYSILSREVGVIERSRGPTGMSSSCSRRRRYTERGSTLAKANPMRAALILAALLAAAPVAGHAADSFLDRARNAVQQAGKDVQSAAKKAGRS